MSSSGAARAPDEQLRSPGAGASRSARCRSAGEPRALNRIDERIAFGSVEGFEAPPAEVMAETVPSDTVADVGGTDGVPDVILRFAHEPRVVTVGPSSVGAGTHTLTLDVEEIVGTPVVAVPGDGVTVTGVRSVAPGRLEVDVVVDAGAAPGPQVLRITDRGDWPGRIVVGAISTGAGRRRCAPDEPAASNGPARPDETASS